MIFLVEICLKIWAMPGWLADPMHKLDFAVVSLSLFVDVVVMWYLDEQSETGHKEREAAEIVALLLIICRFWRVVRIIHGFYEISHHHEHIKHQMTHELGGEHDGGHDDGGHHGDDDDKRKKERDSI